MDSLSTILNVTIDLDSTLNVCFNRTVSDDSTIWLNESLYNTVPLFILQLAVLLALNRIFMVLSESYHIPRTVCNIFAGALIGPSALGQWRAFNHNVYPIFNIMSVEIIASLMLVYYVFLVGLEMDLKPLGTCHNKKAISIALAGVIFSAPIGFGLYYLLLTNMFTQLLPVTDKIVHARGALIWAITLSCSEFPEIAKVLAEQKLLLTENGQLALTASLVSDVLSCIFFIINITDFGRGSVLSFACTVVFILMCLLVLKPAAQWLHDKFASYINRDFLESQVVFMLHVVLVFGLASDALGASSLMGAFLLGFIMPKGALNSAVQDRVLDFVGTFMLPLFYADVGERFMFEDMTWLLSWKTVAVVIVLASMAKVVSTLLASMIYHMPLKDGLSLGALMNSKGPLSLIILCTARDKIQLDSQTFSVMVMACWLMTIPIGPSLAAWKKTLKTVGLSSRKTMQAARPDSSLRAVACIHSMNDATAILNLLKASCPSVKSPIQVVAMELVKMTAHRSREASSLIVRRSRSVHHCKMTKKCESLKTDIEENASDKDVLGCFDNISQAIFAEKMKVVSAYDTMHKDIINIAKQRGVTLILASFSKQPTYDGLGAGAATARAANIINKDRASKDRKKVVLENLLTDAACCLGILVDRGFGERKRHKNTKIGMIYVSGADDREALSYAWRMSRNAEVKLTVVRLVWNDANSEFDEADEEYLQLFTRQTHRLPWVSYLEKEVKNEMETVSLLNKIGSKGYDLFLIGRGNGRKMSLSQTAEPVLEEPALGPLGDTLSDLNSAAETSIMVMQRRRGRGEENGKNAVCNTSAGKLVERETCLGRNATGNARSLDGDHDDYKHFFTTGCT